MINAGLYGLKWEDPKKLTFRVPWKHGSRHGWSVEGDAALFQAWATYTGKYKEGRDIPDPRKWKTNFRCALNALPDIKEIREESCPRGKDAFKIYKMRAIRSRDHPTSSVSRPPREIRRSDPIHVPRPKPAVFLPHQSVSFPYDMWWSIQGNDSGNSMSDEDVEIVTLVDEMMSEAGSPYLSSPSGNADSATFPCGYHAESSVNPFQFPRHVSVDGFD